MKQSDRDDWYLVSLSFGAGALFMLCVVAVFLSFSK